MNPGAAGRVDLGSRTDRAVGAARPVRRTVAGSSLLVAAALAFAGPCGAAGPEDARARLEAALEANRWSLLSAVDESNRRIDALFPPSGRGFEFGFARARLAIQGGCNPMVAGYAIDSAGRLTVSGLASGMMACEPVLIRADAALAAFLDKPMAVELADGESPQARLTTASNATLVLVGRPTPEARYGVGTTAFLEIAPWRVACANPLTPETTCLQFRERHFDDQGIAVGAPGPWRPLYAAIEGYAHEEGVRNVVRVKRFDRGDPRAEAAATVYVLDLVVESETVVK